MLVRFFPLIAALSIVATPARAGAQVQDEAVRDRGQSVPSCVIRDRTGCSVSLAAAPAVRASFGAGTPPFVQQAVGRKSPALAGVLSWLIPGTGSFYAGNSGHGTRHLVLGVITIGGVFAGLSSACEDGVCDADDSGIAIAAVSLLGAAVNGIWGIITAVGDAHEHNDGLAANALQIAPSLRVLTSRAPAGPSGPIANRSRVGLSVLRLSF